MRNPTAEGARRLLGAMMVVLLTGGTLVLGAPPPGQKSEPGTPARERSAGTKAQRKGDKAAPPADTDLADMLAKALRDNPDIRVAEAKLREADAELNRIRLQVTQKVVTLRHNWEAQKST